MKENDWQLMRYLLLKWVLPFLVVLSFLDFSVYGKKFAEKHAASFGHYFFSIATVKSLQSSRLFQTILSNY